MTLKHQTGRSHILLQHSSPRGHFSNISFFKSSCDSVYHLVWTQDEPRSSLHAELFLWWLGFSVLSHRKPRGNISLNWEKQDRFNPHSQNQITTSIVMTQTTRSLLVWGRNPSLVGDISGGSRFGVSDGEPFVPCGSAALGDSYKHQPHRFGMRWVTAESDGFFSWRRHWSSCYRRSNRSDAAHHEGLASAAGGWPARGQRSEQIKADGFQFSSDNWEGFMYFICLKYGLRCFRNGKVKDSKDHTD